MLPYGHIGRISTVYWQFRLASERSMPP